MVDFAIFFILLVVMQMRSLGQFQTFSLLLSFFLQKDIIRIKKHKKHKKHKKYKKHKKHKNATRQKHKKYRKYQNANEFLST